jgi:hypothetical protein
LRVCCIWLVDSVENLFFFLVGSILVQKGLALRYHVGDRNLRHDYRHTQTQGRFWGLSLVTKVEVVIAGMKVMSWG